MKVKSNPGSVDKSHVWVQHFLFSMESFLLQLLLSFHWTLCVSMGDKKALGKSSIIGVVFLFWKQ